MNISELAKAFFKTIDERIGPFDRPFQYRPFPFDAGGALNLLTVGVGRESFVTYVSWDLFGHPEQKRGSLGRYELLAVCDDSQWCIDILSKIGRQSLQTLFHPGDTLDISPWVNSEDVIRGIVFEQELQTQIQIGLHREDCGLLRCIGITQAELKFASKQGVPALVERLKQGGVYPRTIVRRESVDL